MGGVIRNPTGGLKYSDMNGTQLFQNSVKNVSVIHKELHAQREDFNQTIQSRFLRPMQVFLAESVSKFNEAKQRFEKVKKEYHQSRLKSEQFEAQYVSGTQPRPIDAERLLSAEQERRRYEVRYRSELWEAVQEAELVVLDRNTKVLNSFRSLLIAEISYHRLAERTIMEKEELLSRMGEYWEAQKDAAAERRRTRDESRAEYSRAEDARRYEELCTFVKHNADVLTGTEIDTCCKKRADDILNATVRIYDVHDSMMSKLKRDLTVTIIENSAPVQQQPQQQQSQQQQQIHQSQSASQGNSGNCASSDGSSNSSGSGSSGGGGSSGSSNDGSNGNRALFALRSTSSFSRSLTCYTKQCCDKWLNGIFADTLADIVAQGESLNIDAKFITSPPKGKTAEDVLAENIVNFKKMSQELLDRIRGSTKACPIQVRELARHMRFEMTRLDGAAVGNLSLSGFIFLRLICPYITSFVVRTDSNDVRRALLNTAKLLQTIANEAVSTIKEAKFSTFTTFIAENRALVYRWYDELTVK